MSTTALIFALTPRCVTGSLRMIADIHTFAWHLSAAGARSSPCASQHLEILLFTPVRNVLCVLSDYTVFYLILSKFLLSFCRVVLDSHGVCRVLRRSYRRVNFRKKCRRVQRSVVSRSVAVLLRENRQVGLSPACGGQRRLHLLTCPCKYKGSASESEAVFAVYIVIRLSVAADTPAQHNFE